MQSIVVLLLMLSSLKREDFFALAVKMPCEIVADRNTCERESGILIPLHFQSLQQENA